MKDSYHFDYYLCLIEGGTYSLASKADIRSFFVNSLSADLSTKMTLVPAFFAILSIVYCWRILIKNSRTLVGCVLVF